MAEGAMVAIVRAVSSGLSSVARRPSLVVSVWMVAILFALTAAVGIESELREAIGQSRLADEMRGAIDLGLMEEFVADSEGLVSTLQPVRLSSVAIFDNFERWISGDWVTAHRGLVAWGLLFVIAWVFMQGGVVEHLVEDRHRLEMKQFFGAGGQYFGRFIRLSLLTGVGYYGVYRLGRLVFPWIERMAVDVTVERLEMIFYLAGVLLIMALLSLVNLVADFAKISMVMHGRRSSGLAALSALFQILAKPIQTFGLYAVMASLLLAWQLLYVWVLPSPDWRSLVAVAFAFVAGQIYIMGRWALRLARFASEIRLVESWSGVTAEDARERSK